MQYSQKRLLSRTVLRPTTKCLTKRNTGVQVSTTCLIDVGAATVFSGRQATAHSAHFIISKSSGKYKPMKLGNGSTNTGVKKLAKLAAAHKTKTMFAPVNVHLSHFWTSVPLKGPFRQLFSPKRAISWRKKRLRWRSTQNVNMGRFNHSRNYASKPLFNDNISEWRAMLQRTMLLKLSRKGRIHQSLVF